MFILSSDIFSHLLLSSIYLTSTSFPFSLSGHPSSSLICRRARRQRSQSPIIVTVRIDKHFKLYIDWSLSGKCSQLASQVMEQSSMFLLTAQSAERKMASFTIQLLNTSITQNCTRKGRFSIVLRQFGTYRRALNCMPQ